MFILFAMLIAAIAIEVATATVAYRFNPLAKRFLYRINRMSKATGSIIIVSLIIVDVLVGLAVMAFLGVMWSLIVPVRPSFWDVAISDAVMVVYLAFNYEISCVVWRAYHRFTAPAKRKHRS